MALLIHNKLKFAAFFKKNLQNEVSTNLALNLVALV